MKTFHQTTFGKDAELHTLAICNNLRIILSVTLVSGTCLAANPCMGPCWEKEVPSINGEADGQAPC